MIVRPVFLMTAEAAKPTREEGERLIRYLKIAQARYFELLLGQDTFKLEERCLEYRSKLSFKDMQKLPNGAAEFAVNELLKHDRKDRWTSPYINVVLFVGTGSYPGGGGGRPVNGGHDKGGGIIIMAAKDLDSSPNFESTIQHELGHSFGLPHVDVYGYDMLTNPSFMSYNPGHHTKFFAPSDTPGRLIPEDMRGLGENRWAFPNFKFDPSRDIPTGYQIQRNVELGPMDLS